ncbi:unnamed protein product, partial [Protopolystoma xenopodis]
MCSNGDFAIQFHLIFFIRLLSSLFVYVTEQLTRWLFPSVVESDFHNLELSTSFLFYSTSFCLGCPLPCNNDSFLGENCCYLALDWGASSLHLYYQSNREMDFEVHPSVHEARDRICQMIELTDILDGFTDVEMMDTSQGFRCEGCRTVSVVSKKIDLWSLPPIL